MSDQPLSLKIIMGKVMDDLKERTIRDCRAVVQSRLDKLNNFPTPGGEDQYDLGYRTACKEILDRL